MVKTSVRVICYLLFNRTIYNLRETREKRTRMNSTQVPKKRVAFVLIDGLADVSLPRLGYKTPLQAAKLPNLDAIASAGVNGLMDPVEVGLACGSDTAHLSLLSWPRSI